VTEAFSISFEKLDDAAKEAAKLRGQLATAPIPEALYEALPEEWKGRDIRAALHSRHFVTPGGGPSFGVMHRMMADFLRSMAAEEELDLLVAACRALLKIMKAGRCRDPREWPLMNLCRPHAEVLVERGLKRDASATVSSVQGADCHGKTTEREFTQSLWSIRIEGVVSRTSTCKRSCFA
jgi:hypothetical protein